jgi:co-chaperonin GroES (HSP10)
VEHFRPVTSHSAIIIPDAAQKHDTHRFGKVVAVGQENKNGESRPLLVNVGDVVMFQINQVMEHTQKYVLNGKNYMNLLQSEIILRLKNPENDISVSNVDVVGDYILLKHFFRTSKQSLIVLPESAMRQSAPEFIYFKVMSAGTGFGKPLKVNDEVICNFGKLTPIFFVKRHKDGTSENEEYCYTREDWIDGVLVDERDDEAVGS